MNELELEYFFFKLPIYSQIKITEENWDDFMELLNLGRSHNDTQIEGYNPFRGVESTFGGWSNIRESIEYFTKYGGTDRIGIKCKRYGSILDFFIHYNVEKQTLMKVGQYPSVADFHIYELKKYNKVLQVEKLKEFSRGIGLAANGVGIGSFVYLRRIFETLIIEAKVQAESEGVITNGEYQKLRIDDRIDLLSDYLPQFLVENKGMYSVLSVGIHELDEKTCLAHFDILRVGIEIILDEKLEERKKKEKIAQAQLKLSAVKGTLKK
jgi:hypothetical protein